MLRWRKGPKIWVWHQDFDEIAANLTGLVSAKAPSAEERHRLSERSRGEAWRREHLSTPPAPRKEGAASQSVRRASPAVDTLVLTLAGISASFLVQSSRNLVFFCIHADLKPSGTAPGQADKTATTRRARCLRMASKARSTGVRTSWCRRSARHLRRLVRAPS